jgi:hypothetical protein
MGMYCACGIKMQDGWKCECSQDGWNDAFEKLPEKDGKYLCRVSELCGDRYEDEIQFSLEKKFIAQRGWSEPEPNHWDLSEEIVYQWKERP